MSIYIYGKIFFDSIFWMPNNYDKELGQLKEKTVDNVLRFYPNALFDWKQVPAALQILEKSKTF